MIETRVPGDVASVRAAGRWLSGSLKPAVASAADHVTGARRTATSEWHGLAGNSYATFAGRLVTLSDDHETRVADAATAVEDYAVHLESVFERMRDLRGEAAAGGLTVSGTRIQPPAPAEAVPALPAEATPAQADTHAAAMRAHDAAVDKVVLYNALVDDVEREYQRHTDWIDSHLGPAATAAEEDGGVNALVAQLQESWGPFLTGAGLEFADGKLAKKFRALLRDVAVNKRRAAALRRARRSGHPGRRAEGRAPDAKTRIRGYDEAADKALDHAKYLKLGGRLLGPVGVVVDGYFGYQEIQEGGSPGGVVLSSAGGALAAAGTVALIATAPVSVPVLATAVTAGVVAVGVSWAVSEGWDALPDGFTDTVDDAVTDAWDAGTDAVSDGWDEVTSWF